MIYTYRSAILRERVTNQQIHFLINISLPLNVNVCIKLFRKGFMGCTYMSGLEFQPSIYIIAQPLMSWPHREL